MTQATVAHSAALPAPQSLPFMQRRGFVGLLFMLPAAIFLIVFLTYPLGLGVWLGFTDTTIGRAGVFIGLENYRSLWNDSLFWLSVFNTILYTVAASILKFALGLWLALLLNEHLPFKAFIRAIVLLPWVVPTVLSAIAFWWIYDTQYSIISWALLKLGPHPDADQFPRRHDQRAHHRDPDQCVARHSVRGDHIAGRPADDLAFSSRGRDTGRRHVMAAVPVHHPSMLSPLIAVVMTFSVLFTFTDFQLIYVLTRGGPLNATHLMATLSFQRAIPGGQLARARPLRYPWCRSCWARSCSVISGCNVAVGSKGEATA